MKALIVIVLFYSVVAYGQNESKKNTIYNFRNRPALQLGLMAAVGTPTGVGTYRNADVGYSTGVLVAFNHSSGYMRIVTGFNYTSYSMYGDPRDNEDSMTYYIDHQRPHFYDFPIDFDLCIPISKRLDITLGLNTHWGSLISTRRTRKTYLLLDNEFIDEKDLPYQSKSQFIFGLGLSLGFHFYLGENYSIELKGIVNSRVTSGLFSGTFYEFRGGQLSIKRRITSYGQYDK